MPIGVVIGPLSAIPFRLIESSVVAGQRRARGLHHVDPGLLDVPLEVDAVASSTRRVASVSSGPVPSPGMRVTV